MNESNSIKPIDRRNLTEQTKIRLDKITETESYFHQEINQRKLCSKKLSKYVAAFDYIVGEHLSFCLQVLPFVGIASASFTLIFPLTTGIIKKLLSIARNKKKKHHKILMFPKSKLNSVEN